MTPPTKTRFQRRRLFQTKLPAESSSDVRCPRRVKKTLAYQSSHQPSSDELSGYDFGKDIIPQATKFVRNVDEDEEMSDDELMLRPRRLAPALIDLDDLDEVECKNQEDDEDGEKEDEEDEEKQLVDKDEDMLNEEEYDDDQEMDDAELTDEETTLYRRPETEQQDILREIGSLYDAIPGLAEDYELLDRLGTGTFSSVYKAIDLGYHDKWDNSPWQGHHPPTSSAYYQSKPVSYPDKIFVAVKRIHVTSSPDRILNEIAILEDCRSCRHVSQLITAFRHEDQVVAVMPYHRNEDFRVFYQDLPVPCIKSYMQCLLRALRDIHARNIIHRDVKPANFLFDPRTGVGTLCDFGLACRMTRKPEVQQGSCFHSGPLPDKPHGHYDFVGSLNDIQTMQRTANAKSNLPSERVGVPANDKRPISKANRAGTRGFRAPEVLLKCGHQSGAVDVWAAGVILLFLLTKKFPIFQSNDDTEALMELATILGRKKMGKTAALHARTFSTNINAITLEGMGWRNLVEQLNPTLYQPPEPDPRYFPYSNRVDEFDFVTKSRSQTPESRSTPSLTHSSSPSSTTHMSDIPITSEEKVVRRTTMKRPNVTKHTRDIRNALDLAEQLLMHDSTRRITPKDALAHAFFAGWQEDDEDTVDDDEHFPHPFGHGVCGSLHDRDEMNTPIVACCIAEKVGVDGRQEKVWQNRQVSAGQGVAIGNMPCEFHEDSYVDLE